ncbi:hypothetical protein ACN28S_50825 [Cystobacter fuscus]
MRAPLLAVALTAHPYAEPFWARDLTALVERLAAPPVDPADAEQQRLFGDVVRFLDCEPLAPLRPEDSPLAPRALLRLEVARRGRLGASAASSATLWHDVLTPDFFRRAALLPENQALRWPIEEESWSSETLELRLRPSSCAQPVPATDELPLLTAELEREVDKALGAEVAHRLLYHHASRLLTLGRADEAREVARRLSPTAMGDASRPLGQLLRLGLGIEPPAGYRPSWTSPCSPRRGCPSSRRPRRTCPPSPAGGRCSRSPSPTRQDPMPGPRSPSRPSAGMSSTGGRWRTRRSGTASRSRACGPPSSPPSPAPRSPGWRRCGASPSSSWRAARWTPRP